MPRRALGLLAAALVAGCAADRPAERVRALRLEPPRLVSKRAPAPPSRALGRPERGRLLHGRRLAAAGPDWVTWDPVLERTPNRAGRRWGTQPLLRVVRQVLRDFRRAHPGVPRVLVGDLSRPQGGVFDARFGGLGHLSHQNGVDVDVYYPRRDRRPRPPRDAADVDRRLSQDLVDRFVAAGARVAFVGPGVRLRGPRRVVRVLAHHDDHVHVRLPGERRRRGARP